MDLEGVEISEPSSIFAEPAYESKPFSICVPDDAVSLALYGDVDNAALPSSWFGSDLGEIVGKTKRADARALAPSDLTSVRRSALDALRRATAPGDAWRERVGRAADPHVQSAARDLLRP